MLATQERQVLSFNLMCFGLTAGVLTYFMITQPNRMSKTGLASPSSIPGACDLWLDKVDRVIPWGLVYRTWPSELTCYPGRPIQGSAMFVVRRGPIENA